MITLGIDARSYDSPGRLGRYCRNVLAGMLEHGEGFRYVVWLPDGLRPELLPNLPEEARLELRACAVATGDAAGERGAFLAEINGAPLDVFCSLHSPVPAGVAAPSLLVIHDLCALKFPELHPGEAVEYWQSTLPGSLERVTAIIAESSQTAADVELYFPRHAHRTWVIPPGVEPQLPRGGRRWLFFDPASHLPVLMITHDNMDHEVEYYCYDRIQYPVKLDDLDFDPDKLWPTKK